MIDNGSAAVARRPKTEETPALHNIWKTVFGDSDDEIDKFFETYFEPQMSAVADSDSGIASAAYLLPVGNIRSNGAALPCAMIYAVATLPEHRCKGCAAAVVRELISTALSAGFKATVLCPSDDSLFEYYSARTPFREWFYAEEQAYSAAPPASGNIAKLAPAAPEEYMLIRETLLSGISHIEFDLRALSYQEFLCRRSGGGLYRAETSGGAACAALEKRTDNSIWIKELLAPRTCENESLSAIAAAYPAPAYHAVTPVPISSRTAAARRFGMLAVDAADADGFKQADQALASPPSASYAPTMPYYGLAFD